MKKINFTEIAGFQSGQATDTENGTGVTIILSPAGATAGVDVRGGGPATRETDLLSIQKTWFRKSMQLLYLEEVPLALKPAAVSCSTAVKKAMVLD